ncbi:hypothetical protein PRVXT_001624 [Proteinivorax tanatarense]|uniref:Uncharacterized protein n=1 Tax=Proteinivorax tanatarense TaxID=1260629 RepID=A0AAU7VIF7_9FIRM
MDKKRHTFIFFVGFMATRKDNDYTTINQDIKLVAKDILAAEKTIAKNSAKSNRKVGFIS